MEFLAGLLLAFGLGLSSYFLLAFRPSITSGLHLPKREDGAPAYYEAVLAAIMAYGFYAAAALMEEAELPRFFRDHLFDGLAPAAVVGFLVSLFPRDRPGEALQRIRRPVWILVLFAAGGALIFGLIASAAGFEAGSSTFPLLDAAGLCAALGAFIFAYSYYLNVSEAGVYNGWRASFMWWFKKRPASPDPPASGPATQETGPAAPASGPVAPASGAANADTGAAPRRRHSGGTSRAIARQLRRSRATGERGHDGLSGEHPGAQH